MRPVFLCALFNIVNYPHTIYANQELKQSKDKATVGMHKAIEAPAHIEERRKEPFSLFIIPFRRDEPLTPAGGRVDYRCDN